MITFEIRYKDSKNVRHKKAKLALYTNWNELSFSHFERLCNAKHIEDEIKRIKEFIRILAVNDEHLSIIQFFDYDVLQHIDLLISFINDLDIPLPLQKHITDNISVELSEWRKLNTCHDALTLHKDNVVLAARECIKAYSDVNIDELNFPCVLAIFYDISKKIEAFHEKFKVLHEHEYSNIEIRAGVQVFEQLKWFHTAKALSDSGITKLEGNKNVLDIPANIVYMWLVDDLLKANYKKKLQELQSEK